jgi:hypothetical protein
MKFQTSLKIHAIYLLTLGVFVSINHVEGFTSNPLSTKGRLGQHGKFGYHNAQSTKPVSIPTSTTKSRTWLQISTIQPVTVLSDPLFQDSAPPVKKLGKISSIVTKVSPLNPKFNQRLIRLSVNVSYNPFATCRPQRLA